jgi:hypothetical protein
MKKVLPFLFAVMAMGIVMLVVASALHLDLKAELQRRMPIGGTTEDELPTELPEA